MRIYIAAVLSLFVELKNDRAIPEIFITPYGKFEIQAHKL